MFTMNSRWKGFWNFTRIYDKTIYIHRKQPFLRIIHHSTHNIRKPTISDAKNLKIIYLKAIFNTKRKYIEIGRLIANTKLFSSKNVVRTHISVYYSHLVLMFEIPLKEINQFHATNERRITWFIRSFWISNVSLLVESPRSLKMASKYIFKLRRKSDLEIRY